jgi:hypothetical protein
MRGIGGIFVGVGGGFEYRWLLGLFLCFVFIDFDVLLGGRLILDLFEKQWVLDDFLVSQRNLQSIDIVLVVKIGIDLKSLRFLEVLDLDVLDICEHLQWQIKLVVLEETGKFSRLFEQLV